MLECNIINNKQKGEIQDGYNDKTLPELKLESIDGSKVPTLQDFKGKPLLILFFYLGCPGCKGRAIPFANKMKVEFKDKLNVIGVHSNFEGTDYSDEEITKTMEELYARFPTYRDFGHVTSFHAFEAGGTPHWILLNKEGDLVQSIFGSDPNRALLRLDYTLNELLEK